MKFWVSNSILSHGKVWDEKQGPWVTNGWKLLVCWPSQLAYRHGLLWLLWVGFVSPQRPRTFWYFRVLAFRIVEPSAEVVFVAWLEVGVKTLPLQCQNSLQKATDLQEMWPNNLDASSIKDQSTREKNMDAFRCRWRDQRRYWSCRFCDVFFFPPKGLAVTFFSKPASGRTEETNSLRFSFRGPFCFFSPVFFQFFFPKKRVGSFSMILWCWMPWNLSFRPPNFMLQICHQLVWFQHFNGILKYRWNMKLKHIHHIPKMKIHLNNFEIVLLMVQKSQTTTWDVWNLFNTEISHQPQLVQDFFHSSSTPGLPHSVNILSSAYFSTSFSRLGGASRQSFAECECWGVKTASSLDFSQLQV